MDNFLIDKLLSPYFRFTLMGGETPTFLLRPRTGINEFKIITQTNIMLETMSYDYGSKGKKLYDYLQSIFSTAQDRGVTSLGVTLNTKTGDIKKKTLQQVGNELKMILLEQSDLYINIDDIEAISDDKEQYCFNYLNLNPDDLEDTVDPIFWTEFEQQMPEELVPMFRSWIWSIFDVQNNGRQMLILTDDGMTGKSIMIKLLSKYLNSLSYTNSNLTKMLGKDSLSNQFWGSKIYDKRLIVFGDSGNQVAHKQDKIKTLTGNDGIDVERKGKDSFDAYPKCKVLIATNRYPDIDTTMTSERSRNLIIPLTMTTNVNILKKYYMQDEFGNLIRNSVGELEPLGMSEQEKDIAYSQIPTYLKMCYDAYQIYCPKRDMIITPHNYYEKYIIGKGSSDTEDLIFILNTYFEMSEEYKITNSELKAIIKEVVTLHSLDLSEKSIKDYLKTKNGVKDGVWWDSKTKKSLRGLFGVRLNNKFLLTDRNKLVEIAEFKKELEENEI